MVHKHRESRRFRPAQVLLEDHHRDTTMQSANSKFVTRFIAVAFVAAAFVGCFMMFSNSEKSLFGDTAPQAIPQTISQTN